MTATTYPSSPERSVRATATRRAVKAEWTKLRTLPSTWRTVALTVVAAIGFSALATWDPLESTCRHASLSIL